MEEQLQTLVAMDSEAMTAVAIYLTIVSGYLVVAYMAGRRLSLLQVMIVSVLFVAFALYFSITAHAWFRGAFSYSDNVGITYSKTTFLLLWLQLAGIIASLWFMFDQRKNERKDT